MTLASVVDRFRDDNDIQLHFAMGAVNAMIRYSTGKRWDDMAAWLKTLASVADRFLDNSAIQFELARGRRPLARYGSRRRYAPGRSTSWPAWPPQVQAIAQEFKLTAFEQITRAMAELPRKRQRCWFSGIDRSRKNPLPDAK